MIFNMVGGSGGASGTLTVTAPAGVTVTAARDGKSYTRTANAEGVAVFKGLSGGTWVVTISDGVRPPATVSAAIVTDYDVVIDFEMIPVFTYTGDYEVVSDNDEPITSSQGNWKIRFLTSGTLTFTDLRGAANGIDVFLVGAGGGCNTWDSNWGQHGGGSGFTTTARQVSISEGQPYEISIGAGGGLNAIGGTTSAFGAEALGGNPAIKTGGGTGGSNGGGYNYSGGSSDGNPGQGTTTREFGESEGKLYAGGGAGGGSSLDKFSGGEGGGGATGRNGETNTGGGAGGSASSSPQSIQYGGSGIVIIRNAREAA